MVDVASRTATEASQTVRRSVDLILMTDGCCWWVLMIDSTH